MVFTPGYSLAGSVSEGEVVFNGTRFAKYKEMGDFYGEMHYETMSNNTVLDFAVYNPDKADQILSTFIFLNK